MFVSAVLRRPAARFLFALPALLLLSGPAALASTTLHSFRSQVINGYYPVGRMVQWSDGNLYGTTQYGGANNNGAIFQYNPATTVATVVYSFTGYGAAGTGYDIVTGLILADDGKMYGAAANGGANGYGTVFRFDPSASPPVTRIHNFNYVAADGAQPQFDSIFQASDHNLYVATAYGGANLLGALCKMALDGTGFQVIHSFKSGVTTDGYYPFSGVAEGNDGKLYGTTLNGGANGYGIVYSVNKDGSGFTVAHNFSYSSTDGRNPYWGLTKGLDGKLYGTTQYGGFYDLGNVYSIDPSAGGAFSIVYSFDGETGAYPQSGLSLDTTGNLYGASTAGGANGYGTAFMLDTSTPRNYTVLTSFTGADANNPLSPPILGSDGNLYGVSQYGGLEVQFANSTGSGSLYTIPAGAGSATLLHSFNVYEDGYDSVSSLILGVDGNLYGVTFYGGVLNAGIFYQATPAGAYQILHTFNNSTQEGQNPTSIIQGPDGNFYGTCATGGRFGSGTVWMMDGSGNLTVLHHFRYRDGGYPHGRLLFGADGKLYGTTANGGATGYGTVFTLATDGTGFADLHDFDPAFNHDGSTPYAGLVQDAAGTLYGATLNGGANGYGAFFKLNTNGTGYSLLHSLTFAEGYSPYATPLLIGSTVYAVCLYGATSNTGSLISVDTSSGAVNVLHPFSSAIDGANPYGDLYLGADGLIYGANAFGGPASGNGTVWKSSTGGAVLVLQTFTAATGRFPYGGVVVDATLNVYGTTSQDGPNGGGTLFSIP